MAGTINQFLIQLYFSQIFASARNKMWSKSLTLAMTIAELDGEPEEKKQLRKIYNETVEWLKLPLPVLESRYESALRGQGKMRSTRIDGKEVYLHEIIQALSDAYVKTTMIVAQICKRTGVELEFDMSKYGNVIE